MSNSIQDRLEKVLIQQSKGRNENLTLEDLPEPKLIPGMVEAAERIIYNLKRGLRLLLVGDYDCDGILATVIFMDFFRQTKYSKQIDYIVPDRFIDGYGVSKNMVDYAINNEYDFIVTVDNGIGAKAAVDYAQENGVEVIITDHHTPGDSVPNVDILVDLKYDQGEFPFLEISGATMSWYLCCQVREILDLEIDMRDYLDLVGITVISDVMPLCDINLVFFREGMKLIKNRHRRLYKYIFSEFKNLTLNETDLGFGLVPMINAVGRIDHAKHAVDLFLSRDLTEIKKGVKYLKDINNKRKVLNDKLFDLVLPEAQKIYDKGEKVIVVRNENLHEGIVGILAGKIAERFNRPAFVFGFNKDKQVWKGSGRTTGKIHLFDLASKVSALALGFGGHAGAVGAAVEEKNFKKWKKRLGVEAKKIDQSVFLDTAFTPIEIDLEDVNDNLIDLLDKYRPFGQGFPQILFKSELYIQVKNSYKEGLHWETELSDKKGKIVPAWFFHNKTIGERDSKEEKVFFTPQRDFTNEGLKIGVHATIPHTV